MSEAAPQSKKGFKSLFKSKSSLPRDPGARSKKLTKKPPPAYTPEYSLNLALRARKDSDNTSFSEDRKEIFENSYDGIIDRHTGERRDHTNMMHSLAYRTSFDSIDKFNYDKANADRDPGDAMIASLSPELWGLIATFMSPLDAANLAHSCRTLRIRLGPDPWDALKHVDNHKHKIEFLVPMDGTLPNHLFCYPCAKYHLRTQRGEEKLRASIVLNPLFKCPKAFIIGPSRTRLVPYHNLPYTFVQLALRAERHSPAHGIGIDSLARRYKTPDTAWTHQTRYYINNGHLLMRVVSSTFATAELTESAMRLLLYSREDYLPYFSVCDHWRDGVLMDLCKCALGHIPRSRGPRLYELRDDFRREIKSSLGQEGPKRPVDPRSIITLCDNCRHMRRCPECPTEYLIELRLTEDTNDKINTFKQAMTVTRWSDLGDGSSPYTSLEWAAINGKNDVPFDSFTAVGKRAVSGIFESAFTDTIPGQRILSLNPKKQKRGEAGNKWY